jgi:streptogramin lyase
MRSLMAKSFANDPPTAASQEAMARLLVLGVSLLVGVPAAGDVHVSRVGGGAATAGKPLIVRLAVRPKSFSGRVQLNAIGPGRLQAPAHGRNGSYRARLVFPRTGAWTLTARAGSTLSRLGSVRVRPAPLAFDQPTGVAVGPAGSLLVVEFGQRRLLRVDSATGGAIQLAKLVKPWGVAMAPSGTAYVSDSGWLKRIDPGGTPRIVATADPGVEIGPVAVAPDGDVVYSTASAVYRLVDGSGTPQRLAAGTALSGPHGIAVATDGSVLLSDTGNDVVRRIDPAGAVTVFAAVGNPRGIAVARNGTVYVAVAGEQRVVRFSAAGQRLGAVGPRFDDVYALAVAPDGTVYGDDIGAGLIRRVSPSP